MSLFDRVVADVLRVALAGARPIPSFYTNPLAGCVRSAVHGPANLEAPRGRAEGGSRASQGGEVQP
jgi:hypothetical protein